MDFPRALDIDHSETIPTMPSWITAGTAEALEKMAFLSGAALNHLHLLMARDDLPESLLRARRALRAAEACVRFSGRPERAGALRDAVHFLRPGDLPGPGGEVRHNAKFKKAPAKPDDLHRGLNVEPLRSAEELCWWENRYVGKQLAFSYDRKCIILK